MNDSRIHYYVDDINAWQNLEDTEVGWHAGDGSGPDNGTTIAIEIIMDGSGSKEDLKAEENGALLAAILLKKYGLTVDQLYTHNHWAGRPDKIIQGVRKNCPLYILPHWEQFKAKVAEKLTEISGSESSSPAAPSTEGKTAIMGRAEATAAQMAAFCLSKNASPRLPSCSVEELASLFLAEGETEGVRGDVAFAQSLLETGYFKFGGIVLPTQNNYGGLGALNGNNAGQAASFPDPRSGVRAQIQHLKAYASTAPLANDCVDLRFSLVVRGSAECVEWLGAADNPNGRGWAVPGNGYGKNIIMLLEQIKATEASEPTPPTPPDDGYPEGTPAWQKEGFEALVERGIINSPDYWKTRFDKTMTAGEILAIFGTRGTGAAEAGAVTMQKQHRATRHGAVFFIKRIAWNCGKAVYLSLKNSS